MMTKESKAVIVGLLRREEERRRYSLSVSAQVLATMTDDEKARVACTDKGQPVTWAQRVAIHQRAADEIADLLRRVEAQPTREDGAGGAPTCALCGSHLPEARS
jgi:hypothetical protein